MCLHEDFTLAKETITRIRVAESEYGMHVVMAHDVEWMHAGEDAILLSLLFERGREEFLRRVREGLEP